MRIFLSVLTAILLLGGNNLHADDDAAAIIRKGIEAHGREKNLAKLMMCQGTSEGTLELVPGLSPLGGHTFMTEFTVKPGKFKEFTRIFLTGGPITIPVASAWSVFNGEEGQVRMNGTSQLLRDAALQEFRAGAHERHVCLLSPLLNDREYRLSVLHDEGKVSGKAVVALKVRRRGDKEIILSFDKDTGRLVKSKRSFYHIGNKNEGEQESFYKNFKVVHGALVPHQTVVYQDGKQVIVGRLTSINVLKEVDDSEFDVDQ